VVVSGVRCRLAYGPVDATATHSLAPVNPDWYVYLPGFIFLVPAHPSCPGQNPEGRKMVVVVVVSVVVVNIEAVANRTVETKTTRRQKI